MTLVLREVGVEFDRRPAIADVSLELPRGKTLAVLGPSGCGKSTLLRAIAGIEPLSAGSVSFDGMDLARVPVHRRGFGLIFQDGQLFEHLDVAGNISYPLRLRQTDPNGIRRSGIQRSGIQRRVTELLQLVGLAGFEARESATLSGGERQRVALARSLAASPRLLLLDEPMAALDSELRTRLAGELRAVLRDTQTTAIWVTHDHEEAFTVGDRLAVMRSGRLIQHGPAAAVWQHPADAETALFLGYAAVLEGQAAQVVLAAAGVTRTAPAVAVRRSAFVVAVDGPLTGHVVSIRSTPDQLRLRVRIPALGHAGGAELDAVGAESLAGGRVEPPAVGSVVSLAVDPHRLALLGL